MAASPRAALVGIHDPDAARAAAVGREAGGAPALPFAALLDACDALIVAAPAEAHYALAEAALRPAATCWSRSRSPPPWPKPTG